MAVGMRDEHIRRKAHAPTPRQRVQTLKLTNKMPEPPSRKGIHDGEGRSVLRAGSALAARLRGCR